MNNAERVTALLAIWAVLLTSGCSHQNQPAESESTGKKSENSQVKSEPILHADDSGKDIFAKAIKAYGGEKAFSRWRCGHIKYQPKPPGLPEQITRITIEDTFQLPGQHKRVNRMSIMGKELVQIWVQDNETIWQKNGNQEARVLENNPGWRGTTPEYLVSWNLPEMARKGTVSKKPGEATINNRPTMVVRAESELLEFSWYFDKQTALLTTTKTAYAKPPNQDAPSIIGITTFDD